MLLCLSTDVIATIIDAATFFLLKKLFGLLLKKIFQVDDIWKQTFYLISFDKIRVLVFLAFFQSILIWIWIYFFSDNIWIEYDTRYHKWIDFRYELKKTCFIRLILFLKWHLAVANNFFSYSGLSCFTKDTNELLWSKNSILLIKKYQFIIRATKQGYYFFL